MKAFLKNYRQSPRKVRLVAGAVKGKRIEEASLALSYMPKRAATPLKKLIDSAVANAEAAGSRKEDLVVKSIEVNKGAVLKRWMPRAFGRSSPINKRTSHVQVVLAEKAPKAKKQRSKVTEKKQ